MLTKPLDFYFYSHMSFEPWDFTNPTSRGIGGSETSHIEMSARLAQRNHNVVSYAPVPWGEHEDAITNRNVKWYSYKRATFKEPGYWIIYRYPEALDNFPEEHPDQEIWYIAQDTTYPSLTEERGKKIDRYICLCEDHASYSARKYPFVADKIWISSNGISIDKIKMVEAEGITRNPKRLIWTSSPDRGLEYLISIFKRALEYVPDLELHIFYGFDNIDKFIEVSPGMKALKEIVMKSVDNVSIFWHGRRGQYEIIREFLKSGIWCYPTEVTETSCITCMEAQALGAIPITNPRWGLRSNVYHGILLEGHVYTDKYLQAAFTGEIVRMIQQPALADAIRKSMMMDARVRFNWERYVDQWEQWIYHPEVISGFTTQFAFQHKYAYGDILNVGCDIDSAGFKKYRNAVNMDVIIDNPSTGAVNEHVDILADIRDLDQVNKSIGDRKFDTVILGDILEHMTPQDEVLALRNASTLLKPDGIIIVTIPNDKRPPEEQGFAPNTNVTEYINGVSTHHLRPISLEEISGVINEADLKIDLTQVIDYTHFTGHGIVCSRKMGT